MTNEQRLCDLLPTVPIYYFDSIASTNDWLKQHTESEKQGTLVLAAMQTKGRGRLNRPWFSVKDKNIAMSILIKEGLTNDNHAKISMLVAVAICEVLQNYCDARIKWPNDILIHGKKCGGILIETVCKRESSFMVIGIGLNVNNDAFDSSIASLATSIFLETGQWSDITVLITQIYQTIFFYWQQLKNTNQFTAIWQKYCAWSCVIGKNVFLIQGETHYYGRVQSIDPHGVLCLLSSEGKVQRFIQGEISLRVVESIENE